MPRTHDKAFNVQLLSLALVLALAAFGCGTSVGGGGGMPSSGGMAGTPCDATYQGEGCLTLASGAAVMTCGAAGTWSQKTACTAAQYCAETSANDPAAPGKRLASCVALPTTGGATDAGATSDGTTTAADAGLIDTGNGAATDTGSSTVTDTGSSTTTDTGSSTTTDTGSSTTTDTGSSTTTDTGSSTTTDTGAVDTGSSGQADTSQPMDAGAVLKYPLPVIKLLDVSPGSPTSGQMVTLDQFAGKYIAVLMGAGWCASCNAQADYMEKIRKDLLAQGRTDIAMVVINTKSAGSKSNQTTMATCSYSVCSPKGAPLGYAVLQGTSTYDWHSFQDPKTGAKGKKNDCFIYAPDGAFIFKHVGKGTVNLTAFNKEVRAALAK